MSPGNNVSFTSSFLIWIPFLFLLWLLWLGLPNLCWIKVVQVDIFVSGLRGNFSAFHHWVYINSGLLHMSQIKMRYVSSMLTFWKDFFLYHKWMLMFIKSPFYIYWDDYVIFIFWLVNAVSHNDRELWAILASRGEITLVNGIWSC